MNACLCCLTALFIVSNIMSGIAGLALVAVGVMAFMANTLFKASMEAEFNRVVGDISQEEIDAITSALHPLAYGLIAAGMLFFVLALFACYGLCCRSRCMFITYSIFVAFVMLGAVGMLVAILLAKTLFYSKLEQSLLTGLEKNYVDGSSSDDSSSFWNILQPVGSCCGAVGFKDYYGAKAMNRTSPFPSYNQNPIKVPATCCQNFDFKSSGKTGTNGEPLINCMWAPTEETVFKYGCARNIWQFYEDNKIFFILPAVGFLAILVFKLIISIALSISFKDKAHDY